jgi:outer membrane protein TolC
VLRQVIYADRAWTGYTSEKHLQESRESDLRALQLDVAQEAGEAYLNVLRAKTFENIQKQNLDQTRSNLSLARVRDAIGAANPNEVLRWESQIANNRINVIAANAQRNLAEIDLNRILNRPAEQPFATEDVGIGDPALFLHRGDLISYLDNPWEFKVLRAFLVQYGLDISPEIQALRAAIAAQDRLATNTGREFWIPQLALEANAGYVFLREGSGSEPGGGQALPPEFLPAFGQPEEFSWSVALSLDYALFKGGQKLAERGEALEQLAALRFELEAASQRIEQRIRSASHLTGASYATITQSRLAAEAANASLTLVEDAYGRGAATIIDLLDAQNNALIADLTAATSVYTFMIDLLELERAVGKLALQMTDEERDDFLSRLRAYFERARQVGIE